MSRTVQTNQSQIEVLPERGGIVLNWRVQDREIFYLDKERFANPELSIRGGNPILFPICGNLPDNKYTHNGKEYTLKQHGFARELPWELVGDETSQEKASLSVALNSNDQTREVYPFDFKVLFTYVIQGNTLEIRQEYTNLSSEPMPFSVGFHPYFQTVDKTQLKLEIPAKEYQDQLTQEIHSFNGSFDYNQDVIDVTFKHLSSNSTSVTDNSRKLKLDIEYDDIYSTLVFWTVKGKDFYCLEPWSAARNSMNTGENLTVLAPQATQTARVAMKINFL